MDHITATPAATDFSAFFLTDSSTLDLELPNGEPMLYNGQPVKVHLHGPSTEVFAKAKELLDREATKRVVKALGKTKSKRDEEDKEADAKFLAAITSHFENFPYPGGPEAIYREPKLMYVSNQVRNHVNSLGNFFKD